MQTLPDRIAKFPLWIRVYYFASRFFANVQADINCAKFINLKPIATAEARKLVIILPIFILRNYAEIFLTFIWPK